MAQEMQVTVRAYQILEKTVKESGNSGRVYVPKEWVGRKVKVMLLEPLSSDEKEVTNQSGK
jgi:putative transposon-encoded protein